MERIGVLINKLQELYQQNAPAEQIIHIVQMLQTELFLLKQQQHTPERKKIAVMMPGGVPAAAEQASGRVNNNTSKESDGLDIGAEGDIPAIALPAKNGSNHKETIATPRFNVLEEVPTLAHQPQVKELNEVIGRGEPSINERLFERRTELGEKLKEEPLKDIKKAVGVNDRFIFISELFRGDEDMYERSLKTINRFTIYPEAEFWILRELKLKLGWNEEHPAVKQFDQLVKRRFL
ncbi:hypothetical protein [Agriterribacter sp.]|uniref:hypothetical protein n=1 Tax=Agriterribacter sp. TaxID=2821509 RepID=UPI002BC55CDD|nr:hypothetical protein [Agriterribacter sp.]HRO45115.1 hypothetical protein [Agriterribacter sp.]HRQ15444.1 hypothetical protein [Agriterribacter sp.]